MVWLNLQEIEIRNEIFDLPISSAKKLSKSLQHKNKQCSVSARVKI